MRIMMTRSPLRALHLLFACALTASACSSGESASAQPAETPEARHLFVATSDGALQVLGIRDGAPGDVVARVDLGDPLGFLAFHPTAPIVYALGKERLHALGWDPGSGSLAPLGDLELGLHGTHVALDPSGRFAIIACYGGDSVQLVALDRGGVPDEVVQTLGGKDVATFRRAHQVRVHPATGAVHVPCLGSDHVATLALDVRARKLELVGTAATPAGAGPRHLDYHPTLPRAYALNEKASSITTFAVDGETGALTALDTVSNRPEGRAEGSRSSDIHVAPSGRFLYAVNREPLNEVVSFAVADDGSLTLLGRVSTGGDHARTFALAPDGARAWVANTKSQELTSFEVAEDGALVRLPGEWRAEALIYCVLAR